MSVKLYADEHVHSAIVDALRSRGVDVLTVQEDGMGGSADADVLARAMELGRVIFSRDADFLREAVACQRSGRHFSGVIYAHQQRVSVRQCIDDLALIALACNPEDSTDHIEYLPLR